MDAKNLYIARTVGQRTENNMRKNTFWFTAILLALTIIFLLLLTRWADKVIERYTPAPLPTTEECLFKEPIPIEPIPIEPIPQEIRTEQGQELLNKSQWSKQETPTLIEIYSKPLQLADKEKQAVVGVLTAETGGWGWDGKNVMADRILVAQCIRKDLENSGKTIFQLANNQRYARPKYEGISEQSKLAYELVFVDGKGVSEREINYFYAPAYGISRFHETRELIVETNLHKYFS